MNAAIYHEIDPPYIYEPEYSAPCAMTWAKVQAENLTHKDFRLMPQTKNEITAAPDVDKPPLLALVPMPESFGALLLLADTLHPVDAVCAEAARRVAPADLRRVEKLVLAALAALMQIHKLIR